MAHRWSTAWVSGASTGIGRELVVRLAERGVRVAASARSAEKLDALARLNPEIFAVPVDVTDPVAVKAAHARVIKEFGQIDLAILNAGVWDPMGAGDYNAARVAQSMAVNYLGVAHMLEPLLPPMIARQQGQVALVASVAGYRGLPKAAAYAPGKAAVISLAEVLQHDLAQHGVVVSLVNPGFVDTPMTAVNTFPMPFIVGVDMAADRILRGLEAQRFEVAFPWQLVTLLKILRVLPYRLYFPLVRRLMVER